MVLLCVKISYNIWLLYKPSQNPKQDQNSDLTNKNIISHHAQSLHMGPKDNTMTRYWQYYVGQTIQEHLFILKVDESSKLVQKAKFFAIADGKEGRTGWILHSHIMSKASIWVPKIMPWQDIGNIRLAKQSRNICISWKWVKKRKLSHRQAKSSR